MKIAHVKSGLRWHSTDAQIPGPAQRSQIIVNKKYKSDAYFI
jgi:hypothetical protein